MEWQSLGFSLVSAREMPSVSGSLSAAQVRLFMALTLKMPPNQQFRPSAHRKVRPRHRLRPAVAPMVFPVRRAGRYIQRHAESGRVGTGRAIMTGGLDQVDVSLHLSVLGAFAAHHRGRPLDLPPSRKTR